MNNQDSTSLPPGRSRRAGFGSRPGRPPCFALRLGPAVVRWLLSFACLASLPAHAQAPAWWTNHAVLTTNSPNDFAPVNQGQVKWLATQAAQEFSRTSTNWAAIPGASNIIALAASLPASNNFRPANLGQLKQAAAPFYDFLALHGLTNAYPAGSDVPYPWSGGSPMPVDFAGANVGQAKYLFSFGAPMSLDGDGDGVLDIVELHWSEGLWENPGLSAWYTVEAVSNDWDAAAPEQIIGMDQWQGQRDYAGRVVDGFVTVDVPWRLPVFDGVFTNACITIHGMVKFNAEGSDYRNTTLPTYSPACPFVAPFWDDLMLVPGRSQVSTVVAGVPGFRRFVVNWKDVARTDDPDASLNFQVVFVESNGVIQLNYGMLSGAQSDGSDATIGMQAPPLATTYAAFVPNSIRQGLGLVFRPAYRTDVRAKDSDGDGMPDGWELAYGFNPLCPLDGPGDSDGDGLSNADEAGQLTDPRDFDTDRDALPDGWEVRYGLNPRVPDAGVATDDGDGDGLTGAQEVLAGTDPNRTDTDGDGVGDGQEVLVLHTNPLDVDSDSDGVSDGVEVAAGSQPLNADTDGDGFSDGYEITNVFYVVKREATNRWISIEAPTNAWAGSWDCLYSEVNLGMDFSLFGRAWTNGWLDGNGVWSFGDADLGHGWAGELPDTNRSWHALSGIGHWWGGFDWCMTYTQAVQTASGLAFVLSTQSDTSGEIQWAFFRDSGEIQINYRDFFPDGSTPMTIGLQNDDASRYTVYAIQQSCAVTGSASIVFTPVHLNPLGSSDIDQDGLPDEWEVLHGLCPTAAHDASLDPDQDGLDNWQEFSLQLDPHAWDDTDGDGMPDGWELRYGLDPNNYLDSGDDFDADGLINGEEYSRGKNPIVSNGSEDEDQDGLTNGQEYDLGTSAIDADTDGDGMPDGWEIQHGLDPTCADDAFGDRDGDHVPNLHEYLWATDLDDANSWPTNALVFPDGTNTLAAVVAKAFQAATNGRSAIVRLAPGNYPLTQAVNATGTNDLLLFSTGTQKAVLNCQTQFFIQAWGRSLSLCGLVVINSRSGYGEGSRGSVCSRSGPLLMRDCVISNCVTLGAYRGGIWADGIIAALNRPTYLENCLVVSNQAVRGGIVCGRTPKLSVVNCTLADNATTDGYAVLDTASWYYGPPRIQNCILWGGNAARVNDSSNCVSSCIQGGGGGADCITNNPLLVSGTYRLQTNSPCISRGLADGAPTRDMVGNMRGATVDMGAYECVEADADGDQLPDGWESAMGLDTNANHGVTDADGDGLSNLDEYRQGANPSKADSDDDGLADPVEFEAGLNPLNPDTDGDGLPDGWEVLHALNPHDPADALLDADSDGLTNLQEFHHGTDPRLVDTDNDGLGDLWEVSFLFDPLQAAPVGHAEHPASDPDGDGLSNSEELSLHTNPSLADTDGDGLTDKEERDVYHTDPLNPDTDGDAAGDDMEVKPFVVSWSSPTNFAILSNRLDGVALAASQSHVLMLTSNGMVEAWGDNWCGATEVPTSLTNAVAVAADYWGSCSLALRSDGTVVAWGENWSGQLSVPETLTNAVSIAAGWEHCIALRADGTVVGWGTDYGYGVTSAPEGLSNAVAISAGGYHNLALRSDGTVVAWGYNWAGLTNVPEEVTNVVAIAAGEYHNLALLGDGTVRAWGYGGDGQLAIPADLSNVVRIAASSFASFAITANGRLHAWGQVHDCPVSLTYRACAGMACYATGLAIGMACTSPTNADMDADGLLDGYELRSGTDPLNPDSDGDGMPDGWEHRHGLNPADPADAVADPDADDIDNLTECQMGSDPRDADTDHDGIPDGIEAGRTPFLVGWTNATESLVYPDVRPVSLHGCWDYAVALNRDGRLSAWGRDSISRPETLATMTNIAALAAGYCHCLALSSNGSVAAWGENWAGQATVPAAVTNACAVAAGYVHSLAVLSSGSVAAWGDNSWGQTDVPESVTNAVAVQAGEYHSLALLADGRVLAWGDDSCGQTNVPADATNVMSIAAGIYHNLALLSNGTVKAWGANGAGETDVPECVSNAVAVAAGYYYSMALLSNGDAVVWGGWQSTPVVVTNATGLGARCLINGALVLTTNAGIRALGDVQPCGRKALYGTPNRLDAGVVMSCGWPTILSFAIAQGSGTSSTNSDTDADGMPDGWEFDHHLDPNNPADAHQDADGDGLSNIAEHEAHTDPQNLDSDGDGLADGEDTNPAQNDSGSDADGDGLSLAQEFASGTDPFDTDSDGDGLADGNDPAPTVYNGDVSSDAPGATVTVTLTESRLGPNMNSPLGRGILTVGNRTLRAFGSAGNVSRTFRLAAGQDHAITLTDSRPGDTNGVSITVAVSLSGVGTISPGGVVGTTITFPGQTPAPGKITIPGIKICYAGTSNEVIQSTCMHPGDQIELDAVIIPAGSPYTTSWTNNNRETFKYEDFDWWWGWNEVCTRRVDLLSGGVPSGIYGEVEFHLGATTRAEWHVSSSSPEQPYWPMSNACWSGVLTYNNDDDNLNDNEDQSETGIAGENDMDTISMSGGNPCSHCYCQAHGTAATGTLTVVAGSVKFWQDNAKGTPLSPPELVGEGTCYLEGTGLSATLGDTLVERKIVQQRDDGTGAANTVIETNAYTVMRLDVLGDLNHDDRVDKDDMLAALNNNMPGLVMGCGSNNMVKVKLRTYCNLTEGSLTLSLGQGRKLWMVRNPTSSAQCFVDGSRSWTNADIVTLPRDAVYYLECSQAGSEPITYSYTSSTANPPVNFTATLLMTVIKVDIATDINNDGIIDAADESIEEAGLGEVIRVNDDDDIDGNGDGNIEEDDLQYIELKIEPALTKGKVWFTYNTSKVKLWKTLGMAAGDEIPSGNYASPTWDLGAGATLPAYVFAEGLATTAQTDTEASRRIILHWSDGSTDCTDTLLTTVTKDLGHYAYFAAVSDYIKEKRSPGEPDYRLFDDKVAAPGGPGGHTHNIVAMLIDDVTMSVHDARAASHWYYGHVLAAKPNAVVIANAAYFEETWPQGIARGICVNGGAKMPNSRALISGTDPIYANRGWAGQAAATDAWQYGVPSGGIPPESPVDGSIRAAVGGLLPMLTPSGGNVCPAGGYGYDTHASIMIGWTDNGVLFLIANDVASNHLGWSVPTINMQQLVQNLADSGAICAYTLDGSESIALSHRNRLGNDLAKRGTKEGYRHQFGVTWNLPGIYVPYKEQRVSNYIILDWKP